MQEDEATLVQEFALEMTALTQSGAGLLLELSPAQAWYLLSVIQLALRHPALATEHGSLKDEVHAIASDIEQRLCAGRPAMTEVARRGWDNHHDTRLPRENS